MWAAVSLSTVAAWFLYNNLRDSLLREERLRESERQAIIVRKAADVIAQYYDNPSALTKRDADVAFDEAEEAGLSINKRQILYNFHLDVGNCRELGDQNACFEAIRDQVEIMKIALTAE